MFDWDEANTRHVARHGVTPAEAEEVVEIAPVDLESQMVDGEERFLIVGVTTRARVLVVTITWRGDLVRVVTAFEAPPQVQRRYWQERGEIHG